MTYEQFLQTAEWKKLKYQVWKRENGICQACKVETANGDTHHIDYRYGWLCPISNLEYLCRPCHCRRHNKIYRDPTSFSELYKRIDRL